MSTLLINSWYPPMGPPKPTMALTSQKNGSCLIANPPSPSSVTIDSSGTSANPTGGCTSIVMQVSLERISWGISVDVGLYGTTLMVLPTFSHWLKYASSSMSPMTVPSRMSLWFISQMGPPSDSSSRIGDYITSTLHLRESPLSSQYMITSLNIPTLTTPMPNLCVGYNA